MLRARVAAKLPDIFFLHAIAEPARAVAFIILCNAAWRIRANRRAASGAHGREHLAVHHGAALGLGILQDPIRVDQMAKWMLRIKPALIVAMIKLRNDIFQLFWIIHDVLLGGHLPADRNHARLAELHEISVAIAIGITKRVLVARLIHVRNERQVLQGSRGERLLYCKRSAGARLGQHLDQRGICHAVVRPARKDIPDRTHAELSQYIIICRRNRIKGRNL